MKIVKYLSLVLLVALAFACKKQEIEYKTTTIKGLAEFQLHYFVPVNAVAANYINTVKINDSLYASVKAPLSTYNAIPNGAVGKFYTVVPGTVNIKMYQGTAGDVLVYNQNVTLTLGKQNVFVHDFNLPPVVFDNGFPYVGNITDNTDSICWVKFYNFLYESAGVPTPLLLQYQCIDQRNAAALVNIGPPIAFGQSTGWQPVKIVKSVFNSAGSNRVDYRIKVIDANGNVVGDLQIKPAAVFVSYADFWTGFIGRRYHHVLSGMRTTTPSAAVRVFTAL